MNGTNPTAEQLQVQIEYAVLEILRNNSMTRVHLHHELNQMINPKFMKHLLSDLETNAYIWRTDDQRYICNPKVAEIIGEF